MNDEIKEILDKLKDNDWYEELDLTGTKWIELKQEETNQLLDYITNLQQENKRLNNTINELKWKPIEEYDKGNYDWVLVKYFDGDYECVPCVAEKRFGKWYSIDEKKIQFDVKYFMDMQQIDKLKKLKEGK